MKIIHKNDKKRSIVLALFSSITLSMLVSIAKSLDSKIPTILIVCIRNILGLIFLLLIIYINKNFKKIIFKKQHVKFYFLRSLIIILAMLCTYYAYRKLPLSFIASISMSNPLFTAMLSYFFLKQKINKNTIIIIIIGYLGVLMVIKPTILNLNFAVISALLANILASFSMIISKILTKDDNTITIMFFSNLYITLFSILISSFDWQILLLKEYLILGVIGLLGITSQFCLIQAIKLSSPYFISPIEYTRIVFSTTIGYFVFNELPDLYAILGTVIILFSSYAILKQSNP